MLSQLKLTPYELFVVLGTAQWNHQSYPMDYYARDGGPWSNYYKEGKDKEKDTGSKLARRRRHLRPSAAPSAPVPEVKTWDFKCA